MHKYKQACNCFRNIRTPRPGYNGVNETPF